MVVRRAYTALVALTLLASLFAAAGCKSLSGQQSGEDAQKFFKDGGAKDPNGS